MSETGLLVLIYGGIIAVCFVVVLAFLIPILLDVRKNLKRVNSILKTVEDKLEPTLEGVSEGARAIGSIIGRVDRIMGVFMWRIDTMSKASESVKTYLQRFAHNPKAEIESFWAGIKRGIEVITKKKGE